MQSIFATNMLERPITSYLLGPQNDPAAALQANPQGPGGFIHKASGCDCLRCACGWWRATTRGVGSHACMTVATSRASSRWRSSARTKARRTRRCSLRSHAGTRACAPARWRRHAATSHVNALTETHYGNAGGGGVRSLFGTMSSLPIELLEDDRTTPVLLRELDTTPCVAGSVEAVSADAVEGLMLSRRCYPGWEGDGFCDLGMARRLAAWSSIHTSRCSVMLFFVFLFFWRARRCGRRALFLT